MRRAVVVVTTLLVITAPSAVGAPAPAPHAVGKAASVGPGTTVLVDRPSGTGAVPSDQVNTSGSVSGESISDDGRFVVFHSESDGLSPAGADREVTRIYVRDRVANTTTLVSANAVGQPASDDSYAAVISGNGDRVAFVSTANNLVTGVSGTNVYVKDLSDGQVILVSRRTGPAGTPNSGFLSDPTINTDGTKVAWWTYTSLDPLDTNSVTDIYKRDLSTDTTTLISLSTGGTVGTQDSRYPSISGNGALIAFESASPLVPSDANGQTDIYVRSGSTTGLVSANAAATGAGNGASYGASVSDDGLIIGFGSEASNLIGPGLDTNGRSDVFARDLGTDTTLLVSRPDGTASGQLPGDSYGAAVSGNGSRIGFTSGTAGGGAAQAYSRTVATNTTTLLSRATGAAGAAGAGSATAVSLTTDGATASFGGEFANLGGPDKDGGQVYVREGNVTSLVSRPTGVGAYAGGARSSFSDTQGLSDDGRYAVFSSHSDGLAPNDNDAVYNAYLRDLVTNQLRPLTPGSNGATEAPRISANGRTAAFVSFATNVGAGVPGIYAYDVRTGALELVSRGNGPNGTPLPPDEYSYGISGDGRRIAFDTNVAIDPVKDTNGLTDVYIRDLDKNTTTLVSRANGAGTSAGNGGAFQPTLDFTGNRVAFSSTATNFGDGDTTPTSDIRVRDLKKNQTILVSRPAAAPVGGDAGSRSAVISGDGTRVAFASDADNLDGSHVDEQVFLRDLAKGTTRLVSRVGAAGAPGDSSSRDPDLSTDGSTLAYVTDSDNLGSGPTTDRVIVVRTLSSGASVVASRANGANGALAKSATGPSLSGNGGCVLFDARGPGFSPAYPSPDFNHVHLRALKGECPMVAPKITKAKIKPKAFRAGDLAKITFKLSEKAKVTLKVGKAKLTKKGKQGKNTIRFKGKLGKKTLKPGTYKLVLQAKDAAGNRSTKVKIRFTILK